MLRGRVDAMNEAADGFSPWLERWALEPDGAPILTQSGSRLLPVRRAGARAMLKVASTPDERRGGAVMAWWAGDGAAPILAHDGEAVLMARAHRTDALAEMARNGHDERATAIVCATVAALHRRRKRPPPELPPLTSLFRALRAAASGDPRLAEACAIAEALLAAPQDEVVLHGDIHHGNILDFGGEDWRAVDPWGYVGERAYDYANLFRNPDLAMVNQPGRIQRQFDEVVRLARLDPGRLRRWIVAHAGLSVAWCLEDGVNVAPALAIFERLSAKLPA